MKLSGNKDRGRSRKKKVTLASRFYAEMMKAKRWISAAVCVSMLGSSIVNPAMLAYADSSSDDEEIQEFELESEAIGQAITEAIADGSLVTAEDLGFSGAEEDTYAELFDADGLLYEVKPEIEETTDEDGDLDLRIFVRLDVVDLLDEGETLDGYEITGDEDVFFMLVNDTDSEQNAIVIVDGRETDVITVAPESEVAEAAAEDAEIVIPAAGGSGAGGAAASDEEAEVVILDEEATEEAEPTDDTEDAEPADDATDDVASADDDMEDAEPADDVESKDETEDADPAEEADNADDADSADDSDDAEQDDAADEKQDDTGAEDSGNDASDNESDTDSESGDSSDTGDSKNSDSSNDSSNDSSDSSGGSDNSNSSDSKDNGDSSDNDSDSSDSSDDSSDSSEVASISVHKYNLVTLAASPADAEEAEEELIVSENSNQLDGELYDAVAMEDGAAVVFVTTTEELGLEGVLSSGNDSVYTAETETAVITAVVPDEAFEEEVYLYAEEITESSETWQQVEEIWAEKAAEEGVSGADSVFVTYDICFKNAADEEVEPEAGSNIAIRIRFIDGSVLTGYDETADNLSLLHISDDGEVEEIEAMTTADDADGVEAIEYEASSFSLYMVSIMAIVAEAGDVARISETTYETLQSAINAAQSGDTVTLLVNQKEDVSITSGQNLTLDLGGYTLTGTGTTGKPAIENNGGTLKLENGTVESTGDEVLINVTSGGTLTLENTTIDGKNIKRANSLIQVKSGDLTINDKTIIENNINTVSGAVSEQEAAVTVLNGNLTMNGGTVSNNTGNWGGGIAVVAKDDKKATMTLNKGTITKNTANKGGGIFLYGNATLEMNGGYITENTAKDYGGGIAVWSGAVATINEGDISSNKQTTVTWGGGGIYVNAASGKYGEGKLNLYNVEMTENASSTSDDYDSYRATISICQTGTLNINMNDGSVIHDNETSREIVLESNSGEGTFKISPFMLSGGAYNWTLGGNPVDVEDLVVDRNSLLQFNTNITALTGRDRIKTTINDNTASGLGAAIGVNGELTIGHDDGEVTLEIKKVWGEDVEKNESVKVEVFAVNSQGTKTHITGNDTVTLNKADDWTKTIEHLPKYDSFYDQDTQTSGTYTYMVVEKESDSEDETASYSAFVSCVEVDDGDDNDDTVKYEITVANLQEAELSIKKIVEGTTTDQSFDFEIELAYKKEPYNGTASASDATDAGVQKEYALAFTNGKANVTLKADETLTLTLGAGMKYTVTETDSKGASKVMVNGSEAENASGTITADGASIVVTNIYTGDEPTPIPEPTEETGDLTVSKTVVGTGADTTKAFTFTVTLNDASISGTYGDMTFANGVATFTLTHGQSKTANDLPEDVSYVVTEEAADHYTSSSENETGTIESDVIKNVVFTNTYTSDGGEEPETGTGTLTVSKTVTGSGSKTREFTFTVTLSDTSINGTYGDMEFVDGVATFTLKHGESVTAEGLPEGVTYTVTETSTSGYRSTSDGATGTIENGGIATVAFTNSKTSSGGGSSSSGSGGGSSSSSSTSGTTAGSTSGPGVASSDSGTSDSGNPGDPGDPASSSDADPLTALPKTGDNGTNTAMFTLLFGMVAVAYVILSDKKKKVNED